MAKTAEDLQKHTLLLIRGDYAKLQEMYPEVGAAAVIRRLVNQYVSQIESAASASADISL